MKRTDQRSLWQRCHRDRLIFFSRVLVMWRNEPGIVAWVRRMRGR